MKHKAKLLESDDLKRTLQRFAHQFIEPFDDPKPIGIIGMQTRGIFIAKRVAAYIKEFYGIDVPVGVLDVTFYRDDFRSKMKLPTVQVTEIPFDIYGKHLILVDDVLYTGRTVRSAMEAIMSFGRPSSIKFCCLVDRGHRELPIYADYVGVKIPTHTNEEIRVFLKELDSEDAVYLVNREDE
ncbi:bifunctional pyr operon transcriptional regulator/uracil phosphoribosyltransferase PyrR [bacterium]|nr:MAG: bifunctional pyr operon transcriptional regulator/uracil phosphoribosyltransferase PyrR [bacterium]